MFGHYKNDYDDDGFDELDYGYADSDEDDEDDEDDDAGRDYGDEDDE